MLSPDNAVLAVIDIQGKLAQLMNQKEMVFDNAQRIVKGAQILGIPIIVTEQNPKGLGPTIPEIAALFRQFQPLPKFSFSCCADPGFSQALKALKRKQVLITGIEAHVCIYQTSLDLMSLGHEVYVVSDVVSSRTAENRVVALQRMRDEGVKITSTEMALFELLKTAEAPQFKDVSRIVK
jgi:nicotinamidase-related amidase